ncbi:uncharacterized protein [Channa argus]|uniref:uncharacterized protein n=1 Tax=Channa argus TaxID=215402 RepID=UPI00351FBD2C
MENNPANQPPVAGADRPSKAPVSCPEAVPEQPGSQSGWSVDVSNRFSQLSDTPAEKPTLIIGSSIFRNVKLETPVDLVKCIPGAKLGNIESYLKLLAKDKSKYSKIIIHTVTKINAQLVCNFAKTMSDSVFSGPQPNLPNDNMYSYISSFNCLLSRWCLANNMAYIDNWKPFWGKPRLIRRDEIHTTLDGAALLSRNMAGFIRNPKV